MANTTGMQTRLIAAMLLGSLLASVAGAQDFPLPYEGSGSRDLSASESVPAPNISTPTAPTIAPPRVQLDDNVDTSLTYEPTPDTFDVLDTRLVPAESSGTWLDRGYWYSEVEAVAMVRQWNRQRLILMGDGAPIGSPAVGIVGFTNSNRSLSLGRSTPGREGSARFTLGRFLFRDNDNIDHNMEFTVYGGGEFGQNTEVESVGGSNLQVLDATDLGAPISFDGASSAFIQYDSRFNSFELNYKASTRLQSDRMELMPSGEWVRRANRGLTYDFLAGVRYVDLTENIAWDADFTDAGGALITDGDYLVRTSNDAFGPQAGFAASYKAPRFTVTTTGKFGVLANDLKTRSSLAFTDAATNTEIDGVGFSDANRTDTLTVLTEFSVVGRYHIRPNISWRAGYQLLFLTHVGLAPHQLDFEPGDASVASTGDVFYHGLSTGIDFYW